MKSNIFQELEDKYREQRSEKAWNFGAWFMIVIVIAWILIELIY